MRPRGRLLGRYVIFFAGLVCVALLASGLIELYFSYQENKTALVAVQREKAQAAAGRIEQYIREIERQMGWTTQPVLAAGTAGLEQRRVDFLRLQRQVPPITELSYLDASGHEQLRVSRLAMDVAGSQTDLSRDPKFVQARAARVYYGPVTFRKESEPYMTLALAGSGQEAGVTVAEVNLKFIWDVVSQIKVGKAGHAYVVDGQGALIAHPDISLVLQKTSLASLDQVKAAVAGLPLPGERRDEVTIARDLQGRRVLTAYATIAPLRWSVFVEQPLEEAFAPLRASIQRTVLLLLLGIALSVAASLLLARKMVKPIQALQAGAARIEAGQLGDRIEVHTGDELEALAQQFNSMGSRLQESYATLEQKVEDRTRALSESLEQQTATAEVLRVITSSPTDMEPVFQAILANAERLCEINRAVLFLYDGAYLEAAAQRATSPEFAAYLRGLKVRPGPETPSRLAALERRIVHIPDQLTDPRFSLAPVHHIENAQTVLAVPMLREGALVGVLTVWRNTRRPFSEQHIELLRTFADQAVIAVESVRLFHEIQEKGRQLEAASQHKSEFLANMSHELRTPLNAVIGFSDVLLQRMFGEMNDKQEEYLRDIRESGAHLLSLINDILDLSKIEAGRMELEVTDFALPEAIENALILVRERAGRRGLTLEVVTDDRVGMVRGDERKIKQVLLNLLSNAIKFTPAGGRIMVHAAPDNGGMEVSVSDTGIGIAPEDQAAVFEEFRQVGSSGAKHEGTGLGLALSRKFVELHGGTIWVTSEVGRGSTFTFTLPKT
jgi:signal transduction histidine kinase